jgi:hypothetical protein
VVFSASARSNASAVPACAATWSWGVHTCAGAQQRVGARRGARQAAALHCTALHHHRVASLHGTAGAPAATTPPAAACRAPGFCRRGVQGWGVGAADSTPLPEGPPGSGLLRAPPAARR